MDAYVMSWVAAFSYPAVFLLLLSTGVGAPVSEELVLLAAGLLAREGHAHLAAMLLVSLVGVVAADGVLYRLGRTLGPRALQSRWLSRLLKPSRVAWAATHFERRGAWTVFFARFLPGVRAPTFLLAGMSGMAPHRFFIADGLAAMVTTPLLLWLGYRVGPLVLDQLRAAGRYAVAAVVLALGTAALVAGYRRRRARAASPPGNQSVPSHRPAGDR